MTLFRRRSRWPTAQTAFLRTPTCTVQSHCDGANLTTPARIESGICGACLRGAELRAKPPKPLKGSRTPQ